MNRKFLLFLMLVLSIFVIPACSTPASEAGQLAKIEYAQVEVGLGSPTPVHVTIDMQYPNTCSQLSEVTQKIVKEGDETKVLIEVRVMEMGDVCIDDPLSFRMVLPLNAVAMPKGIYSVEVNGTDAGKFEFKN